MQLSESQMKKRSVVVIVLIFLLPLVAPAFIGGGVESLTLQTVKTLISDDYERVFQVHQSTFERGWFNSRSRIELTIDGLEEVAGTPIAVILEMDISHGPFLPTSDGLKLGLAYAVIEPTFEGTGAEGLTTFSKLQSNNALISLLATIDGEVEINVEAEKMQTDSNLGQLTIEGLRGSSRIVEGESAEAAFALDYLAIATTNGSIDIMVQDLEFSGSEFEMSQAISTGESHFSIASLVSSAPLPMTINSLVASHSLANARNAQDALELSQVFSIEDLDWDLPVKSLQWRFQFGNLSRELVANYMQLIQNSQQSGIQLAAAGQSLLIELLGENLVFDNSLDMQAFGGDHSLQVNLSWPGVTGVNTLNTLEPQLALQMIQVQLTLDANYSALMSSPFAQTVIDYERPGFLLIDNGRVKSNIRLTDGVLDINGQLTPLEQFVNL